MTDGSNTLWIIDIRDSEKPKFIGSVYISFPANDMRISGDIAYVTDGSGLKIVDIRPEKNLMLIKGSVPGSISGLVLIRKLKFA